MLHHNSILQENLRYWTQRAVSYSMVNQGELADGHRSRWSTELCRQIDARFPKKRREDIRIGGWHWSWVLRNSPCGSGVYGHCH